MFLAADKTRLQDLDEAARRYLAWASIVDEKVSLDLTPQQVKQAEDQKASANATVVARLPETYQWLLVPTQTTPQAEVEWQALRLTGSEAIAARASKKLRGDELLLTAFGPTRLRMELDRVPLWRGDHVSIKQLVDDFGRYLYLPRLADAGVLLQAVRDGLSLLTWEQDSFAFAESFDDATSRYRGLRGGENVTVIDTDAPGLLVKPEVSRRQLDAEKPAPGPAAPSEPGAAPATTGGADPAPDAEPLGSTQPRRFHGRVVVDAARVGRDAARIADEVISHLSGLVGSTVEVTIEIDAEIPSGAPDHVVRTVNENARTLKFDEHGFEQD